MAGDMVPKFTEAKGLANQQQEHDALAESFAKGAQTSPEDLNRSTLHTGELHEGAILDKPGMDGAAQHPDATSRAQAEAASSANETQNEGDIPAFPAAPSTNAQTPPSAPRATEERDAPTAQNSVLSAQQTPRQTADPLPERALDQPPTPGAAPASVSQATVSAPQEPGPDRSAENHAPLRVDLSTTSVQEQQEGAVIGRLSVTDPDAGDSHSYTLSDDRFEVVNGTLKLKDGVTLDHEAEAQIDIEITATDTAGSSHIETVTIDVTDANDPVTDLALANNSVAENTDGAVVGSLSATDQDAADSHSYTLSDDRFEVVNGALKLKDGVILDHEVEAQIDIDITATDTAGSSHTETVTIQVTDTNDPVTDLGLTNTSVAENTDGAVVGSLSATDQDAGDSHSYTLSDDRFEVVNGALKLKDGVTLDHEAEAQIDLEITATDAAGSSHIETVTIEVTDTNEAPASLALNVDQVNLIKNGSFESFNVAQGNWKAFGEDDSQAWTTNTSIEVWDHLGGTTAAEGDQHIEMDSGHGLDSIIQSVQTSAGQVYDLGVDLRERNSNGTDTVEVYWNDTLVAEFNPDSTDWTTFKVQVVGTGGADKLEFREAAGQNDSYGALLDNVTLTASENTIAENVAGTIVGQLTLQDPDAGDTHTYHLSDERFEVVDGTLKLKDNAALDFETERQLDITVTATDAGGLSTTETFTFNVADTPDLTISTGFHAKYFDVDHGLRALTDIDWDATPTHQETISEINYANGAGSFWEGGTRDTFAAEISGAIEVKTGGTYRFDLSADDGAQLYVNGAAVVNNDGLHDYRTRSGEVELAPGTHHIEVRYFENYGHAGLKLDWEGPGAEGVEPVIAPDLQEAQTVSGMPVALNITHPAAAEGEPTHLTLEGLPAGTAVEAAGQILQAGDDGSVDITGFDASLLTLTPPIDFSGALGALVTMTNDTAPGGGTKISQPISIEVHTAQIDMPSAELMTGFRVDYIDMDQGIRSLDDVPWDAEPTFQDHQIKIDYQNSAQSFWEGGSRDTFAAKITGQVTVDDGGPYQFFTSADDGVVLFINGEQVVDDDGRHGYRTRSGEIELEPGVHDIELRYFENHGHAGLKLEWQGPDTEGREVLQADQTIATDVNGTLDVAIDLFGASETAQVSIEGLPLNTLLTSGDDAFVTDGGPPDLTGWHLGALEISPPAGFEGQIQGEIVITDTAFNGAQISSESGFTIAVGDAANASDGMQAQSNMDLVEGDGTGDADAQSQGWDELDHSDADPSPEENILSEPVIVTETRDVTQIGTDPHERMDW